MIDLISLGIGTGFGLYCISSLLGIGIYHIFQWVKQN